MNKEKDAESGFKRINIAIEKAENGHVIHLSKEGSGKNADYSSRTFIAPDGHAVLRIASSHIQKMGGKLKRKGKTSKARTTKR